MQFYLGAKMDLGAYNQSLQDWLFIPTGSLIEPWALIVPPQNMRKTLVSDVFRGYRKKPVT